MNKLIHEINNKICNENIRCVSFDIFDTLIFRMYSKPQRVFEKMFQVNKELFPSGTNDGDWVYSRRIAEKEAEKKSLEKVGQDAITLSDIYDCLPTAYTDRARLMNLEFECECSSCVLNEEIYNLLKYIYEILKIDIILTSDMYLSEIQISQILKRCGFDLSLVKKIYISSAYKESKKRKGLYHIVIDDMQIKANELLHIGDNYDSDIIAPVELGIHTYFYGFISAAKIRHPFLYYEEEFYGKCPLDDFYWLRLLSSSKGSTDTKNDFFLNIGSMILGPFFTFAAEWIVDKAYSENVYQIRPFMREGKFFTALILNALKYREYSITVEPIYLSRLAVYKSLLSNPSRSAIEKFTIGAGITPRASFANLGIPEKIVLFETYADTDFSLLKETRYDDEKTVYDYIIEFLTSSDTLNLISCRNAENRNLFKQYLQENSFDKKTLTLDLGWNGTTMSVLHKTVQEIIENPQLIQVLLCCSGNVVKNAVDGCVIEGFFGNYGSKQNKIDKLFIPIIEMFCLCEEGPTIGYKKVKNKVVPILDENTYSKEWINNIKYVQAGIYNFQKKYLDYCKEHGVRRNNKSYAEQAFNLIERFLYRPELYEVIRLKTATLDQNLGNNNRSIDVLPMNIFREIIENGTYSFFSKKLMAKKSVTWFHGLYTMIDPLGYIKMNYQQSGSYIKLAIALLSESIMKDSEGRIVIVSESINGFVKSVLCYSKLLITKCTIVICLINSVRCELKIGDYDIISVSDITEDDLCIITTIDRLEFSNIKSKIDNLDKRIKYVSYFEDCTYERY